MTTYLVRSGDRPRGRDVRDADEIVVRYGRKTKTLSTREVEGLGRIQRVGDAGPDKSTLTISALKSGHGPRYNEVGKRRVAYNAVRIADGAGALKRIVRKLREQEADRLATIDDAIAQAEERLRILRQQRQELLQEAFSKGHVVTVAEVKSMADERLP